MDNVLVTETVSGCPAAVAPKPVLPWLTASTQVATQSEADMPDSKGQSDNIPRPKDEVGHEEANPSNPAQAVLVHDGPLQVTMVGRATPSTNNTRIYSWLNGVNAGEGCLALAIDSQ